MTFSVLGIDTQTGQRVELPKSSRSQGLYIIGIQGTGKSGLIENLIIQDIKQGVGVGLLDPHGDLIQAVLSRLPDRRVKDVIYLDLTDYHYPFGLNLFACSDLTNPIEVQKTVDQVMHVFEKLFGVSHDTPLILEYLQKCAHTLIANPGYTMAEIPLLLQDEECRRKLVANVDDIDIRLFWKRFEGKRPSDREEEAAGVLRRVGEFLQPLSRPIVGQSTTTINVRQVMDEGKILLVKLDARLDSVTSLIGSILIAVFLNAAYSRADLPVNKRKQFNLYADEFQRFATDDFATLLTEARKFGIGTTIAHQARYQPGMTDGIRATSLSAANLVVFKVNSKDASELAGEFDITPQEAWDEELEPEKLDRIEEDVIDGEELVKALTPNPVEYLRDHPHGNVQVDEIVERTLRPMLEAFADKNKPFQTFTSFPYFYAKFTVSRLHIDRALKILNQVFYDVMRKRIDVANPNQATALAQEQLYQFLTEIQGYFHLAPGREDIYPSEKGSVGLLLHNIAMNRWYQNKGESPGFLVPTKASARRVFDKWLQVQWEGHFRKDMYPDELATAQQEATSAREGVRNTLEQFFWDILDLCELLAKEPIHVPSARVTPRVRTQIHYITHPRQTIMHPQRSYADMLNEVASELTNLPVFTAQVRISTEAGLVEHTIKTLDPKQQPDKPLFGQELQERIARIQTQNRTPSTPDSLPCCRSRQEVEEEIRTRQERCTESPQEPNDAIYRRQPR